MMVNGALYDLAVDGRAARYPASAAAALLAAALIFGAVAHAPGRSCRGRGRRT